MTDIKFLSRKFMLSILLGIISTYMLIAGTIDQSQWGIVIMSTVVSYIVSKTVDKKFASYAMPDFWDRIRAMFSREFLMTLFAVIAASVLCAMKYIDGTIWFQIITPLAGAYNILNAVEKR